MPLISRQDLTRREKLGLAFLSFPVSLLLTAGAPFLGVMVGLVSPDLRVYVIVLFVVFVVLSAVSTIVRQSKFGGYKKAAERFGRAVTGAGLPMLIALGEVCSCAEDRLVENLAMLRANVAETAQRMCGDGDQTQTRVTIYELESERTLRRSFYRGRKPQPRERFRENDGLVARDLVRFAREANDPAGVKHVAREKSCLGPIDDGSATYESYIAAPITLGTGGRGILFVDYGRSSAYTETDLGTAQLLGTILAGGLARRDQICNPR